MVDERRKRPRDEGSFGFAWPSGSSSVFLTYLADSDEEDPLSKNDPDREVGEDLEPKRPRSTRRCAQNRKPITEEPTDSEEEEEPQLPEEEEVEDEEEEEEEEEEYNSDESQEEEEEAGDEEVMSVRGKGCCCHGGHGTNAGPVPAAGRPVSDSSENSQVVCTPCYRCADSPATVLTRKASCVDCFLEVLRRKFASNLRSHCIRHGEGTRPIAVVMDGGKFSTALLHLLLDRNKRRYVRASHVAADSDTSGHMFSSDDVAISSVLSLDDYVGATGSFADRSEDFCQHVTAVVNALGNSNVVHHRVYSCDHLNEAVLLGGVRISYIAICYFLHKERDACDNRCTTLKGYLTRMYDSLCCDELVYALDLLRTLNVGSYLKAHGMNGVAVTVCDTQELIARRVLMLTCVGAGDRVAFRSAFVDNHTFGADSPVLRLLKSFSSKELALYHRLTGLPEMPSLDLFWYGSAQSTILGCVNELVSSVASAHSSTLHNVCNVVEKLTTAFPGRVTDCRVCGGAVYASDAEAPVSAQHIGTLSVKVTICRACSFFCERSSDFARLTADVLASVYLFAEMVVTGWRQGWSEELRSATHASLLTLCDSDYESFVDILAFWEVFRLLLKADAFMSSCVKAFAGARACGTRADAEFDALLEKGVAKGKALFKDIYLVSQLLNHYVNPHQRMITSNPTTAESANCTVAHPNVFGECAKECVLDSQYTGDAKKHALLSDVPRCGQHGNAVCLRGEGDEGCIILDRTVATKLQSLKGISSLDNWNKFATLLGCVGGLPRQRTLPLYNKVPFLSLGNFVVFYRINEGSFGKVHVGFHKLHRRTYALKVISKSQFNYDSSLFSRLKDEISLVTTLVHPNVVRTFEILETASTLVIAMEYCDGGDMIGLIKEYSPMPEPMARTIFHMVVNGLSYLHSSNICHRDIKPENIFLKRVVRKPSGSVPSTTTEHSSIQYGMMPYTFKIGDFGAATRITEERPLLETVGTMSYAAPEVLGCGGVAGYCGKSADIWSLGVLLYAMLFAELPWHNEDVKLRDAVKHILSKPITFPLETSESSRNLLKSLLHIDPSKRPKVDEVLLHPWLAEEVDDHLVVKKIRPTISKPS
ncbi:putative serine/threonine-protein kinase [Babesia sp. Xinjiang]|uniref:putative serine/threonine-protein kinase n=1 Tax=Babesia sp. Xinjiang TaxID=462227 RepID=UPI000A254DBC|nr:putative serine/threonine-protein kinase [Babesia sp. Xinjiang]ORM41047.1 putative serine/threonine-protein kinase [Babesia sp. Xinjiang]